MTIGAYYESFSTQLQALYSKNECGIITDWVFESAASISRSDLLLKATQELSFITIDELNIALQQLLHHKPIQYVLGEAWFYKMKLKVNEHVLIPRPETEELVELIIKNYELKIKDSLSVLDIGTGSGCIPVALKKNLPLATITGVDISAEALLVAKENAVSQKTEINFCQLNFLEEQQWNHLSTYDIIVSNPPYIPINEMEQLDKNVTAFEPPAALFVPDENPLLFYEKIAAFAKTHLNSGGKIFVEVHEAYAKEVAALFSATYTSVEIKKDFSGKERMVTACY